MAEFCAIRSSDRFPSQAWAQAAKTILSRKFELVGFKSKKTCERASTQARRPAGAQARRRAGRQAGRQASRQAGKQASRQAGKQASRQAGKQASKQAAYQPASLPTNQPQANKQNKLQTRRPKSRSISQSKGSTARAFSAAVWLWFQCPGR